MLNARSRKASGFFMDFRAMDLKSVFTKEGVSPERKALLDHIGEALRASYLERGELAINFICTHNSRRSHMAEIWFRTACAFLNLSNVHTYSGGTEATALYPEVAKSFERLGFDVLEGPFGTNKVWQIAHPVVERVSDSPLLFSKLYWKTPNPTHDFHAVLVCDSASEACPFVAGATGRYPLTFEDPKSSDGTDLQAQTYDARSLNIAREVFLIAQHLL